MVDCDCDECDCTDSDTCEEHPECLCCIEEH